MAQESRAEPTLVLGHYRAPGPHGSHLGCCALHFELCFLFGRSESRLRRADGAHVGIPSGDPRFWRSRLKQEDEQNEDVERRGRAACKGGI